jgi:hypothetical protein
MSVVLTVAPTGPIAFKSDNEYLPTSPEEIANAVHEAYLEGASVAHLHLRDENERPTADLAIARRTMDLIQEKCPIHIQLSTGVGLSVEFEDREKLVELRPRMATLNPCTMSFGKGEFRNPPDGVRRLAARMRELEAAGKVKFHVASVKAVHGEPGKLTGVTLAGHDKTEWQHEADAFLPFFGLTIKLGPIAEFGINLNENLIPVDTARFESQTPGIFAIGDINTYTGKLKLILSGFHEAALMAQAAFAIARPNEKLRFQYTTSSSNLQKKLGVS